MEKTKVKRQINLPEIEKRKCKMCGVEFGINAKQKRKLFCDKCKIISYEQYRKAYQNSDEYKAKQRKTRIEWYKKNRKEKTHFNTCVLCGKEFLTKQGKAKYCIPCLEEKAETNNYFKNRLEMRSVWYD